MNKEQTLIGFKCIKDYPLGPVTGTVLYCKVVPGVMIKKLYLNESHHTIYSNAEGRNHLLTNKIIIGQLKYYKEYWEPIYRDVKERESIKDSTFTREQREELYRIIDRKFKELE